MTLKHRRKAASLQLRSNQVKTMNLHQGAPTAFLRTRPILCRLSRITPPSFVTATRVDNDVVLTAITIFISFRRFQIKLLFIYRTEQSNLAVVTTYRTLRSYHANRNETKTYAAVNVLNCRQEHAYLP